MPRGQRVAPVMAPRSGLESADLPITQPKTIESRADLDGEVIVSDERLAEKDYLDELAFNEDMLEVVLHKSREKFAPTVHGFHVNGKSIWVPVERPTRVPRKFVEVMARSQPYEVKTDVHYADSANAEAAPVSNKVQRYQSARFPFQVLHDPSPKGPAWLAKVMRES